MAWFKVDDGFRDHRKVRKLGKDKVAAVGVWTLCGSWSADNTTDGFVPWEIVDQYDTRRRYAKRLIEVALWRETEHDGETGIEFHSWGDYQPTRAEKEAEREAWRQKKAAQRARKSQEESKGESQGDTHGDTNGEGDGILAGNGLETVTPAKKNARTARDRGKDNGLSTGRTESTRDNEEHNHDAPDQRDNQNVPGGLTEESPRESPEIPGSRPVPSRPVLSGGSVRGESHPGQREREKRPPEKCPKHEKNPTSEPCRACGDARKSAEAWDTEQARAALEARSAAARQAAADRARAVADCAMCDESGYRGTALCDHDPEALDRASRGMAEIRAALAKRGTS